jgi:uncharacterized protein YbjQ (UPF0145 family)
VESLFHVPPLRANLSAFRVRGKSMILVTTTSEIEGYRVVATKGTAQGTTFEDLLRRAESLGANAIVKADYDNSLGGEALFHGRAVVVEPVPRPAGFVR